MFARSVPVLFKQCAVIFAQIYSVHSIVSRCWVAAAVAAATTAIGWWMDED